MPVMVSFRGPIPNAVTQTWTVVVAIVTVFAPLIDILLAAELEFDERIRHRRSSN